MRRSIPTVLLVTGLAGAGVAGACSSSPSGTNAGKGKSTGGPDGGHVLHLGGDGSTNGLFVTPSSQTVTVNPAAGPPQSIQFTLHGAEAGAVSWHSSNPAVGTVDSTGLFTPTGQAGGVVNVEATVGGVTVHATVTVTVNSEQNGGTGATADAGAGGLEGVGGEGF